MWSGLALEFHLSEDDRAQLQKSGQTRLYNRVAWASTYLRKAGLLRAAGRGRFQLTDRGREVLAGKPENIDIAFLETRFAEMREFRKSPRAESGEEESPASFDMVEQTWTLRPAVEERVRMKLERSVPNVESRNAALALMAFAIENADQERPDAWCLHETPYGLALMAGRLITCELRRSKLRVSVIGPIGDDVRAAIGAETDDDEEFKLIPGALLLKFPVEHAGEALSFLQDGLDGFVDSAMARVRRTVSLEDHVPEAIAYIGSVVGRDLPQPIPRTEVAESEKPEDASEDEASASREPRFRGRTPIFEHGQRSIASLMSDIEREVIALPDLQRPFVWEDTKVRDLLDSLFLGFPVGTLVLWHTPSDREARAVGAERPNLRSTSLVIDGQQRLTSLYAVMRGQEVVGRQRSGVEIRRPGASRERSIDS